MATVIIMVIFIKLCTKLQDFRDAVFTSFDLNFNYTSIVYQTEYT